MIPQCRHIQTSDEECGPTDLCNLPSNEIKDLAGINRRNSKKTEI